MPVTPASFSSALALWIALKESAKSRHAGLSGGGAPDLMSSQTKGLTPMPHDRNGEHLHEGDWIITKPVGWPTPVVGRILHINQSTRCSGEIVWTAIGGAPGKSFHAEESLLVLSSDGEKPALLTLAESFIDEARIALTANGSLSSQPKVTGSRL